jgi:peptidyl-prolyl cis-trans isomerase SurA
MLASCSRADAPKSYGPDVWAVVDGREIRREDVERAHRMAVQPTIPPPSEEETLTVKLGVLDELISQDILLERASAAGLQVADTEVDTAFADRRRGLSDEAFAKQLSDRGLTPEEVKNVLRRDLMIQKLIERDITSKVAVSDAEIAAFYDLNKAQFNLTETQYRIAQIVITPVRDPALRNRMNDDAATPADAEKKAQMLMERLRGGADFAALAMDYSEDPQSGPQGGDLGFVPASRLNQAPPELRNLVLQMEPGTVRAATLGGAHTLVLLIAREPAGQRELSTPTVRDGIRDALRERKDRLLRTAYLASSRNNTVVDNRLAQTLVDAQGKPPAGTAATAK